MSAAVDCVSGTVGTSYRWREAMMTSTFKVKRVRIGYRVVQCSHHFRRGTVRRYLRRKRPFGPTFCENKALAFLFESRTAAKDWARFYEAKLVAVYRLERVSR